MSSEIALPAPVPRGENGTVGEAEARGRLTGLPRTRPGLFFVPKILFFSKAAPGKRMSWEKQRPGKASGMSLPVFGRIAQS